MDRLHINLAPNTLGQDFFVGDVHGMYAALDAAMRDVNFDRSRDRLISVGDLVDRGPDSFKCLALLEEPWFFAVRGNHEQMMLDALGSKKPSDQDYWQANGGEWFWSLSRAEKDTASRLVRQLPVAISVTGPDGRVIGVCHAEWRDGEIETPDWAEVEKVVGDPDGQHPLLWGRSVLRSRTPQRDKTALLTIHGHTPMKKVTRLGSALFIDTGAVYGGSLTLISAEEATAYPQTPAGGAVATMLSR